MCVVVFFFYSFGCFCCHQRKKHFCFHKRRRCFNRIPFFIAWSAWATGDSQSAVHIITFGIIYEMFNGCTFSWFIQPYYSFNVFFSFYFRHIFSETTFYKYEFIILWTMHETGIKYVRLWFELCCCRKRSHSHFFCWLIFSFIFPIFFFRWIVNSNFNDDITNWCKCVGDEGILKWAIFFNVAVIHVTQS